MDDVPEGARLVVAMSGGVDSSLVAAVAHHLKYEVIGITLQLYDHGIANAKKGACCAGRDIQDARDVAAQCGFAHYVLDFESRFRESVIDNFIDSYVNGQTPVPCIQCNQSVKFDDLLKRAKNLGAHALLTGHYVQRIAQPKPMLAPAVDHDRDQSWFLFTTTKDSLDFLRFPLGAMTKSQVRNLAQLFNLTIADKPDSQDICFVPNGNYRKTIESFYPNGNITGDICDIKGRILGQHPGIIHYTIGQRRGIGLGSSVTTNSTEALYVVDIDKQSNRITVGPYSALAINSIDLRDVNWLAQQKWKLNGQYILHVKFRSSMHAVRATLKMQKNNTARIYFDDDQYSIATGQACVFYKDDLMLGGGWIVKANKSLLIDNHIGDYHGDSLSLDEPHPSK